MSYTAQTISNYSSQYANDPYGSMFEPDVLLPSQFQVADEDGVSGGERKLMAALLSDGIEAYIAQSVSSLAEASSEQDTSSVRNDVSEWIETKDEDYVFSFDNVCECLGIDADYLRLGLTRYVSTVKEQRKLGSGPKRAWKKIRRPRKK